MIFDPNLINGIHMCKKKKKKNVSVKKVKGHF